MSGKVRAMRTRGPARGVSREEAKRISLEKGALSKRKYRQRKKQQDLWDSLAASQIQQEHSQSEWSSAAFVVHSTAQLTRSSSPSRARSLVVAERESLSLESLQVSESQLSSPSEALSPSCFRLNLLMRSPVHESEPFQGDISDISDEIESIQHEGSGFKARFGFGLFLGLVSLGLFLAGIEF